MMGAAVDGGAVRLRPVRPARWACRSSVGIGARRQLLQAAALFEQVIGLDREVPLDPRPGMVPPVA